MKGITRCFCTTEHNFQFFPWEPKGSPPNATRPWVVWWPLHIWIKNTSRILGPGYAYSPQHLRAGTYKRKVIFHFHVSFRGNNSFLHTLCQTRTQKLWPRKAKHCWGKTWQNLQAASTTQIWNETKKYFPIQNISPLKWAKLPQKQSFFVGSSSCKINFKQTNMTLKGIPIYRYIQHVMVLNPSQSGYVG